MKGTVYASTFVGLNLCGLPVFAIFAVLFGWFVTLPHTCCLSGLNFHEMKLLWMVTDP